MRFFHVNSLNARGILAQKIYNVQTIFRQFSDVVNGGTIPTNKHPLSVGYL